MFFWCIQDQRGTVGLKCLFTVGGVKVRWCALRCVPDVGYWLWWIFVELIIVFLRRATNHDSVNIYIFSPGRSFYRLRLVRNLNGTGFIICSGKVVSVYLWVYTCWLIVISYASHSSLVNPMYFRDGIPCFSLKWGNDWWDMIRRKTVGRPWGCGRQLVK